MPRAMSDAAFRAEQLSRLLQPHIAPFTALVEELRRSYPDRLVPYVAPTSLGVQARILALHATPGPSANAAAGSGFLSVENDDSGAERLHGLLTDAGIDPATVLPWNAVPYSRQDDGPLSPADIRAGRLALTRLVALLPRLRCVVLHGRDTEPVWSAFTASGSALPAGVRVEPTTFSTGDEALRQHRASRLKRLAATYASVADALR